MSANTSGLERCIVCGKRTQSHEVPHGHLCHSCYVDRNDQELLEELPVAPITADTLGPDTDIECYGCGAAYTLEEIALAGHHPPGLLESPPQALGGFDAILALFCPRCDEPTDHLTDLARAREVLSGIGVDPVEVRA